MTAADIHRYGCVQERPAHPPAAEGPAQEGKGAHLVPRPRPASDLSGAPYAPDANRLVRFWLAGPLTLLLFVPALGAGIFGAPAMIPGYVFAWRMLRSGRDTYADFAVGGTLVGLAVLMIACLIDRQTAPLFLFGLLFGPLMAMTFRALAGSWRGR